MNFTKAIFLLIAVIFPTLLVAQNPVSGKFQLKGDLKSVNDKVKFVYLKSMDDDNLFFKLKVTKGRYRGEGTIDGPSFFQIFPGYAPGSKKSKANDKTLLIYLEAGKIAIVHSKTFANLKVFGSSTQNDYKKVKNAVEDQQKKGLPDAQINKLYLDFVKANPQSTYALFALSTFLDNSLLSDSTYYGDHELPLDVQGLYLRKRRMQKMNLKKIIPMFESIPEMYRQSAAGRNLNSRIEFAKIGEAHRPYFHSLDSLALLYLGGLKQGDLARSEELEIKMQVIKDQMNEQVSVPYIKNNPDSPINMDLMHWYSGGNFDDPGKVERVFSLVSDSLKKTPDGRNYQMRLALAMKTAIGLNAPDFTLPDTSGKPISLNSFLGKYVLVDFWASWCGPCRKENPSIIKTYAEYKDKGFEVLSVSMDTDRQQWLNAIAADGMNWTHLSDLKNPNEVVKLYDILGIPANLLISPEGKILAKNLTGAMLGQTLRSFIN